jgi:hypothetical protein
MTTRRQFFALAGVVAVTGLAACTSRPALSPWRGSPAFAVESTDGLQYLLALSPDGGTWARAAELGNLGVAADATVTAVPTIDGSGRAVLVWSNGDGTTKAAVIDPAKEEIRTLDYAVDSGVRGILGDALFSILPGTSGESAAELMPLDGTAKSGRRLLPFLPQVVGHGADGLLLAAGKGPGVLLGWASAQGSAITTSEMAIPGQPLDLCMVGLATAVTIGSTVPGHRPGLYFVDAQGEPQKTPGVETPRLVASIDADHVVIDDTSGSSRLLSIVSLGEGPHVETRGQLESDAPVRDLRRTSDGRIVVTQSDALSVFDSKLRLVSRRPAEGLFISDR